MINKMRCYAGTREMIAGPVKCAKRTDTTKRKKGNTKQGKKREKRNRIKFHTRPYESTQTKLKTLKILTCETN